MTKQEEFLKLLDQLKFSNTKETSKERLRHKKTFNDAKRMIDSKQIDLAEILPEGDTYLTRMIFEEKASAFYFLVENGADIEQCDFSCKTAQEHAYEAGADEAFVFLTEHKKQPGNMDNQILKLFKDRAYG